MDAFHISGAKRAVDAEIQDCIAAKIDATVVEGLSEVVDPGDARVGRERVAGFAQTAEQVEWYLPLSAESAPTWQTAPVRAHSQGQVAFVLAASFGNGSPLPQPSGRWDIYVEGQLAVSVRVVKHSQLWRSDECSFAFAANRIEAAPPWGLFFRPRDDSFHQIPDHLYDAFFLPDKHPVVLGYAGYVVGSVGDAGEHHHIDGLP